MADRMSSAQRSLTMSRIRSTGNATTELRFRRLARAAHIVGWRRGSALAGRPDFVFALQRIVVFIDGCFWHRCPRCYAPPKSNRRYWKGKAARNVARDRLINRHLRAHGWRILRLWEHSLREEPDRCVRRLQTLLLRARSDATRSADL